MAKVQNPVIGRSRGSAGGMTFAKVYDENVMKAKIFEATNPNTAAQQTQRNFFKEVQQVSRTVSDAQLRSLFGTMPKGMSRRNALAKQIAAANNTTDGVKSVDFSMLSSIGNGKKVNTSFIQGLSFDDPIEAQFDISQLNVSEGQDPNIIIVAIDTTEKKILVVNTSTLASQVDDNLSLEDLAAEAFVDGHSYNLYLTCAKTGENVYSSGFGSFTIKTRKTTN